MAANLALPAALLLVATAPLAPEPQGTGTIATPAADTDMPVDELQLDRDRYERLTVPVMIDGKGPFRFFIDTGAQAYMPIVGDEVYAGGGFHLIFCRNVMIYFDDATREKLVRELERLLAPGGYLFIGHTDNPDHSRQYLDQVRPAIFRKRGAA